MEWTQISIIAAPFVRNFLGWLGTAGVDGKYEKWEWTKLMESTLRLFMMSVAGATFFESWGINVDLFSGMAGALLIELIYDMIKKVKKVQG